MSSRTAQAKAVLGDFESFSRAFYPRVPLRKYQLAAASPILEAIDNKTGGSFVVLFSRQAGKDELLAQLQAFLLARYRLAGGSIVMGVPTFKPQALVSKRRLMARLKTPLTPPPHSADGYRVVCGAAGASFLSTEPAANVRGETASVLLVANEAQDIEPAIWDSRFGPMAASTNAPAVFSGTPWAKGSLLSREMYFAESGPLFRADWRTVAEEVPAYREHVKARIAQLGERHPFIRTEYFLEELDAAGGLFDADRQAQMHGDHPRQHSASPGRSYALLLDVAGADEDQPDDVAARAREKRRDSTALTVVEVDDRAVRDPLVRRPSYRVVHRRSWVNKRHTALLPMLADLAVDVWKCRWIVVDSTGIGAGLAEFLAASVRGRCEVIPFVFSRQSKSELGWAFLGAIDSGRYKEYADDQESDTSEFWRQVERTTYSVDPGPGKLMRWSVPDSQGHDDLVLSAALVGALEELDWTPRTVSGRTRRDYDASG